MDFGEKILRGLNKTPMAPGDCVGADGLIYCGKCGEPKQSLPPAEKRKSPERLSGASRLLLHPLKPGPVLTGEVLLRGAGGGAA
jgi:hypothetical protein